MHVGALNSKEVGLAIFGFMLIAALMIRRINGAILIGIIVTTLVGFAFGVAEAPTQWVSMPPSIAPLFLKLDVFGALSWGFFAVILTYNVHDGFSGYPGHSYRCFR